MRSLNGATSCKGYKGGDVSTKRRKTQLVTPALDSLLDAAMAIENTDVHKAEALGYMTRAMILATMPHTDPGTDRYTKKNEDCVLNMIALDKEVGLPYGSLPRLLLGWMIAEAVRTKSPEVKLGNTMGEFLGKLGLSTSGGKRGDATRLREQANRLFKIVIFAGTEKDMENRKKYAASVTFPIVRKTEHLEWISNKKDGEGQENLWSSTVTLDSEFFKEITENPIPIDMRALQALSKSPLAMDIYMWLTYRASHLYTETVFTWEKMTLIFGSNYKSPSEFKRNFKAALQKVCVVYPKARVDLDMRRGLVMRPSPTHVPKLGDDQPGKSYPRIAVDK